MESSKLKPVDLYTVLMHEARYRIEAINFILGGKTKLAEAIVHELCWLQLRMLCETIALSCLVAHGDVVASHVKRFEKEYAADKIIKMMERLNPHFFPQQAEMGPDPITGRFNIKANTNSNALKKSELSKLYHRCGEILHRARFEVLLASDPLNHGRVDEKEILSWAQKIEDLLGAHVIPLPVKEGPMTILICVLRDSSQGFRTMVEILALHPPAQT